MGVLPNHNFSTKKEVYHENNGKAVGKAKITVKMKYGKKTLTKKITVSVTKKTTTNTDTNKPTPKPGFKKLQVDLSTAVDTTGEAIPYDAETGILSVQEIDIFRVDLPETLAGGSVMEVTITGCLNGENGFRAYFINNNEDVNISPDLANSDNDEIPLGEPFK